MTHFRSFGYHLISFTRTSEDGMFLLKAPAIRLCGPEQYGPALTKGAHARPEHVGTKHEARGDSLKLRVRGYNRGLVPSCKCLHRPGDQCARTGVVRLPLAECMLATLQLRYTPVEKCPRCLRFLYHSLTGHKPRVSCLLPEAFYHKQHRCLLIGQYIPFLVVHPASRPPSGSSMMMICWKRQPASSVETEQG